MSESSSDTFRWQAFFQHAAQPIFLLNRRRRVLFVNRPWESCTGLLMADVRGKPCRRKPSGAEREDLVLSACAPPAEASNGRICTVRRRAPGSADWWEIQFVPIAGDEKPLGYLGLIGRLASPQMTPPALPEKLMSVRDRAAARHRLADAGDGPVLERLHEQARLAAQTRLPILLLGEAGAGKTWLARAIHAESPQRQRYFAVFDAERLPPALLGDLLFGPAGNRMELGTVYLREPAFLTHDWQRRIALALKQDSRAESPRLIVGARGDLRLDVQKKRLLEELYFAVSPITIDVPSLRERYVELPYLIETLLERVRELKRHEVKEISAEALNVLRGHRWPGNIRELLDVLRGACPRARGSRVELADLPLYLKQGKSPAERHLPLDAILEKVERRLITLALKLTDNNQTRAAELLEVWRPRLLRRLENLENKPEA
jgi:PAS domain S-box-containing protein